MAAIHRQIAEELKDWLNTKVFAPPVVFTVSELPLKELMSQSNLVGEVKIGNRRNNFDGRGTWRTENQIFVELWQKISGGNDAARDTLQKQLIDLGEVVEQTILDAETFDETRFAGAALKVDEQIETPSFLYVEAEELNAFHWIMDIWYWFYREIGQ